jgi:hypothetical protein
VSTERLPRKRVAVGRRDGQPRARLAARATQYLIVGAAGDVARFADLGWVKEARPGPILTDDLFDTLRLLRPDAL